MRFQYKKGVPKTGTPEICHMRSVKLDRIRFPNVNDRNSRSGRLNFSYHSPAFRDSALILAYFPADVKQITNFFEISLYFNGKMCYNKTVEKPRAAFPAASPASIGQERKSGKERGKHDRT